MGIGSKHVIFEGRNIRYLKGHFLKLMDISTLNIVTQLIQGREGIFDKQISVLLRTYDNLSSTVVEQTWNVTKPSLCTAVSKKINTHVT